MTGGRRRAEDLERPWYAPPIPKRAPTPDEVATLAALDRFKCAMRFRRKLQRALRHLDVSFAEWRVLEAISRLFEQTAEPVSHLAVARELDLGEGSVSRLMWQLSRRGLVSHDLDGLALSLRVLVTSKSEQLMTAAYAMAARTGSATSEPQSGRSSFWPEASQARTPPSR